MGGDLPALRLVACEPAHLGDDDELTLGLSAPVERAVGEAIKVIEELVTAALAVVSPALNYPNEEASPR